METPPYIPIDQCKDNYLYIIAAKNADIGVYVAQRKAFKISRLEGYNSFIDLEFHHDLGDPSGTAKPLKEIEKTRHKEDDILLLYLDNKKISTIYDVQILKGKISFPIVLINTDRMRKLKLFR